ncbi:MAG: BadF/BadG/BcrA/BcrD ATPase family protein [Bacilli bacterium]
MEKIIIAVDAGGTKTKVCGFTANKDIVYESIGGPGAPIVVLGEPTFSFYPQIKEACDHLKQDYEIVFVQLGISGLGIVPDVKAKEQELSAYLHLPVSMENDAMIGLYSLRGIPKEPSILVLAGTGSSVISFQDGKTLLMGGFGHLLTEKGSSFTAVKTLISQIIDKYEQNKPINALEQKFMTLIKATTVYDLKPFVYLKTKSGIADYAKFISQEALNNDIDAIAILKKCGEDLAYFVIKAHEKMQMDQTFFLGFRGSFIQKAPYVKDALLRCLTDQGFHPSIIDKEIDPVEGAYYLAKQKGKI